MLKRKFFAVALPLVAGATIVGSGFAAWVLTLRLRLKKQSSVLN